MYNSAGEVGADGGRGAGGWWVVDTQGRPGGQGDSGCGGGERPKLNLNRRRIPSEIKWN